VARRDEELRKRASMRGLLVEPGRQEPRQLRIVDGARRQELAKIDDGVALDGLHVAQRADRFGGQRLARDGRPLHGLAIEHTRTAHYGGEIEIVHHSLVRRRPPFGFTAARLPWRARRA
jgi:hypothetical protein